VFQYVSQKQDATVSCQKVAGGGRVAEGHEEGRAWLREALEWSMGRGLYPSPEKR